MAAQPPICIVGGGPGGLYAALRLAQLGMPALVLEKSSYPRPKPCGDILTSNVLRALHALDPALVQDLLAQPWGLSLEATAFGSLHKAGFVMPFNSPANAALGLPSCISARRTDFDAWLYRHAAAQHLIEIRQDCAVQGIAQQADGSFRLRTSQGEVHAAYLLLAMGANAPLLRDVFPSIALHPRHSAVGLRMYLRDAAPHPKPRLSEFYLFERQYMPGGLYITQLHDGVANVNAVMRLDIFQRSRPRLGELMHSYLQAHPHLRERFAHAVEEATPAGCPLFFGTVQRPLSSGRCLLIGDAAGLTDATNANGIGHAMISGGMAAEKVAAAAAHAAAPAGYDAAVYTRLRNALRPGKVMRRLFSNPLTAGISITMLNAALNRFNSRAVEELVYSPNTAATLLSPKFYWRLFAKGG